MTTQEVRNRLNDYFPPLSKYRRSIKADANLTPSEVDSLCSFVSDFEALDEKFDWRNNLYRITNVAVKYQSITTTHTNANNTSGKIPTNMTTMPFLIRQVLFYLGVACDFNEVGGKPLASQKDILLELEKNGLILGHNFFSKMGVAAYSKMLRYRQPDMPFNYPGQKHEELGAAIKHLVQQAGSYDLFADVFGGSGAASVAFPRRDNAVYVYNDLEKDLANLFDIISDDDLHLVLIDYLNRLQEDLNGGRRWEDFVFNRNREVNEYYKHANSHSTDNEMRILFDNKAKLVYDEDEIMNEMNKLYDEILKRKDDIKDSSEFIDIVFGRYLISKYPNDLMLSYILNYKLILEFIESNSISTKLSEITLVYRNKEEVEKVKERKFRVNQLRFYEWYAIFKNVSKNPELYDVDKVFRGVGTIYFKSFTVNGFAHISPIYRMYEICAHIGLFENKDADDWIDFLAQDFETIINNLYLLIKKNDKSLAKRQGSSSRKLSTRTIIRSEDCNVILNDYQSNGGVDDVKHKKPLFYLDSPYIATKGYEAGDFKPENMQKLLTTLAATKDKFIFSCRACNSISKNFDKFKDIRNLKDLSGLEEKTIKKIKKIKACNANILSSVFGNFYNLFNTKKIYVLTIANKTEDNLNGDFWQNVRENRVAEVMLTNYEICDFEDIKYNKTIYKVYSFVDFMRNLNANINK